MSTAQPTWEEGFQPFMAPRYAPPTGPDHSVTIYKSGQISISGDIASECFADEDMRAQFWFNPDDRMCAIKPVASDTPGAYKVTRNKGQRVYVNAERFLDWVRQQNITIPDEQTTYQAEVRKNPLAILFTIT